MPPESGGSQFLDTGTAVGLFMLFIVLVLKMVLPYFTKSKISLLEMVKDLHKWHSPKTDKDTGQPKFMWYGDWVLVERMLKEQDEKMNKIIELIEKKLEE